MDSLGGIGGIADNFPNDGISNWVGNFSFADRISHLCAAPLSLPLPSVTPLSPVLHQSNLLG